MVTSKANTAPAATTNTNIPLKAGLFIYMHPSI